VTENKSHGRRHNTRCRSDNEFMKQFVGKLDMHNWMKTVNIVSS